MAHVITYTKSRAKLAALRQADNAGRGVARLEANEELAKIAGAMLARYHLDPDLVEELEKEAGWAALKAIGGGIVRGAKGAVGAIRRVKRGLPLRGVRGVKAPATPTGARVATRAKPKPQRVGWRQRKAQARTRADVAARQAQQQARTAQPVSGARARRLGRAGKPAPAGPIQQAPAPTTAAPTAAAPKQPRVVSRKGRAIRRRGGGPYRQPAAPPPKAPVTAGQAPTAAGTIQAPGTLRKAPKVVKRTRGGRVRARAQAPGSRAGAPAPAARAPGTPGHVAAGPKIAPGQPAVQQAPAVRPAAGRGGTVRQGPAAAGDKSPGFLRRWWKPMALGAGALGMYGAAKAGGSALRMMEQSRQSPWAYGAAWSPVQYGYGQQPYGQFHQSMGQ